MTMMISSLTIMTITLLMVILMNLTSKKAFMDREKTSPFECGFDPKSNRRMPFSLHFFLIAIMFLIFDVEITLLLPMIVTLKSTNIISHMMILTFFIMILITGLLHEWLQGALTWSN
uniref:NADH-ubiquinone oxidoreductase chain 3 n=1 Tax=Scaphidema metallicum TaxID=1586539 RepID=A0A343C3N7_9CUCU|nr:NADH dehydrogenase subunit 3 [Scaphidema metallicum]